MKSKVKPGTRAAIPNATPAQIREGLAAWVREGTSLAGAKATGFEFQTVAGWRQTHPQVWRDEVNAQAEAIRDGRIASSRLAVETKRAGLLRAKSALETDTRPDGDPLEPKDIAAFVRAANDVDVAEDRILRLDAGLATEITEVRDGATDAELRTEIERMLADPKTRAALAGKAP